MDRTSYPKLQVRLLAAAACCLLFSPSHAETPAEIAAKAHLLGTWAPDCSKPLVPGNYHLTYEVTADGSVRAAANFGGAPPRIFYDALDRLILIDQSTISFRHVRLDESGRPVDSGTEDKIFRGTWDDIVEIDGDRLRTLQSAMVGGPMWIKDGKNTHGYPNPDLHRCRGNQERPGA
jgi:hypothetical protein